MDSSVSYRDRADGARQRKCESALGSYALSYSTIRVQALKYINGSGQQVGSPVLQVSAPTAHPDPNPDHVYCLDFLESAFAEDVVSIGYSNTKDNLSAAPAVAAGEKASGLLSYVVSKNIDQTGEIIRNLIRAIFIAVSGKYNFNYNRQQLQANTTPVSLTEQDVNPFDLADMAGLNHDLRPYGYCLTLGDYTYDTRRYSADAYCNAPEISLRPASAPPLLEAAKQQKILRPVPRSGILYRPKQPYSVFVYVRDDPEIGGPWQLRLTKTMMLENISPILGLHVSRSFFAEHRTALAFDGGNLVSVCIAKGSEVEGAIQIPLDVIFGLVSLPTEKIAQEIDLKNGSVDLINKQKDLLALQNQILAAKAGEYPGAAKGQVPGALGVKAGTPPAHDGNYVPAIGGISDLGVSSICKAIE